jgi:hypothetical protein
LCALVDVFAGRNAVIDVPFFAVAVEASGNVYANCIVATVMDALCALVDVGAIYAVSAVSHVAGAGDAAD